MKNEFAKILLVEGNNDKHVIFALRDKFDVKNNFKVKDCSDIQTLIESIPEELRVEELQSIGIMVDADVNPKGRWEAIKKKLSHLESSLPVNLPDKGLIFNTSDGTRVGVWLMPNNKISGNLEDFMSFLIPKDDVLKPNAEAALAELESKAINRYAAKDRSKALVHTWLAWQESPGSPLGQSITRRYLDTDEQNCKNLIDWLTKLFQDQ